MCVFFIPLPFVLSPWPERPLRAARVLARAGRPVSVGTRVWAWALVIPIPSPHSYIENQQHLQQLKPSDLRGLGELRKL